MDEPPTGGAAGPEVLAAAPRVSNRRLLLAALALTLAVVLVLATLSAVDVVRGGSGSPEALARRVVAVVDSGQAARAYALVEPDERAALGRLAGSLRDDADRLGLTGLLGPGGSPADAFAGLDVTLTGVEPQVDPLSDDVALLRFDTGEAGVVLDPAAAHGLLRAALVRDRAERTTRRTLPLSDLGGEQAGVRLVAVREGGRWYVSVLLSLLERWLGPGSTVYAPDRGTPGAGPGPGSASPQEAMDALVRAGLAAYRAGDARLVGPALDRTGSYAADLYGPALAGPALASAPWRLDQAGFTSTAQGEDRARVQVGTIGLRAAGRGVSVSASCITAPAGRWCLTGTGYRYPSRPATGAFELLAREGAFGLTTVRTDGRWRVGLADSLADAAASWAATLTREQVLALLGRVRDDTPTWTVVPGRPEQVPFTSAGYLLATLHVDRAGLYRFAPSAAGYNRGALYAADGQPAPQKFFPNDDSYDLVPGDYTLLLWADDAFADWLRGPRTTPYRQRLEIRLVAAS